MKFLFSLFLAFLLMGCMQLNYFPSDIRRNQVYQGQSLEDLYDNMGLPKRIERYNYGVIGHIYMKEQILNENGVKSLQYCDLRVLTHNDYVVNWDWRGNDCQFEIADDFEREEI